MRTDINWYYLNMCFTMLSFLSSVKMLEGYGQVCVRVNEYQHIRSKKLLVSRPQPWLLYFLLSLCLRHSKYSVQERKHCSDSLSNTPFVLGEHMLVSTSFPEAYLLHDAESLHVPNNDGDWGLIKLLLPAHWKKTEKLCKYSVFRKQEGLKTETRLEQSEHERGLTKNQQL